MEKIRKVISIDTGNSYIKTPSEVFLASCRSEGRHSTDFTKADTVWFDGEYYKLTSTLDPYQRDKSNNMRYYILALFAIGKEFSKDTTLPTDGSVEIHLSLAMGLPPLHFNQRPEKPRNSMDTIRKKYADYYKNDGKETIFHFNEAIYRIVVDTVQLYPQGFAAVFPHLHKFVDDVIYIIDIGGFTTDVYQLNRTDRGYEINSDFTSSKDMGTIDLYTKIKKNVRKITGEEPLDNQVLNVLMGERSNLDRDIKEIIITTAEEYGKNIVNSIRQDGARLKYALPVFIGGGSKIFRNVFDNMDIKKPYFIDDMTANAKGYEFLYNMSLKFAKKG